jgi:methylated-DNA-[protein]-cysteine S-methyltransferase
MAGPGIRAATGPGGRAARATPDAASPGWRAEIGREEAIAAGGGVSRRLDAGGDAVAAEVIGQAMSQVEAWFAGRRDRLDVPLAAAGSRWQQTVWAAARALAHGERITYGELACRLGRPQSARAVGAALGANPCLLFTPCHRVVGLGGRLTGYAGGIGRKRWLLAFEAGESLPTPG